MSKPKFTPGPWEVDHGYNVSTTKGRMIANCASYQDTHDPNVDESNKANTHLIAAAPDMYEALNHFEQTYGPDRTYQEMRFVCEKIHEALAKAEAKP